MESNITEMKKHINEKDSSFTVRIKPAADLFLSAFLKRDLQANRHSGLSERKETCLRALGNLTTRICDK